MIHIEKSQLVPEYPDLQVCAESGDYADTDQVLCAKADSPDIPIAMFAAQFVAYGSMVYRYNTPEELGEAVVAVDPGSQLDAVALYKEEQARKMARLAGTLEPTNPAPTDTPGAQPGTVTTTVDSVESDAIAAQGEPAALEPIAAESTLETTMDDMPVPEAAAETALTSGPNTHEATNLPTNDLEPTAVDLSTTTPE